MLEPMENIREYLWKSLNPYNWIFNEDLALSRGKKWENVIESITIEPSRTQYVGEKSKKTYGRSRQDLHRSTEHGLEILNQYSLKSYKIGITVTNFQKLNFKKNLNYEKVKHFHGESWAF